MRKIVIFTFIVSAIFGLVSMKKYQNDHSSILVNTATITEDVLLDSILASGNLVFNTQIDIRSEITGRVTKVLVEEGETVTKDQVLMHLDDTFFKADVSNYQAAVNAGRIDIGQNQEYSDDLKRQLKQQRFLIKRGLVKQENVDSLISQVKISVIKVNSAQERLNQSLANLERAKDRLSKTVFRAPIAGLLSSVDVKVGETVIAGTTNIVGSSLMTLADPSAILAELRVDEADIANVKMGQETQVFAAAHPKHKRLGKVISIATSARAMSNSSGLFFKVKALLEPSSLKLYPGMSCRSEIITNVTDKTMNIPIAAIQHEKKEHFVWVANDNIARKRMVVVGFSTDLKQAVTSGLSLSDIVITGPSRVISNLKEGDSLQIEQNLANVSKRS